MANPQKIERAFFQAEGSGEKVEVHFNPESLQYTITNNMENQGSGNTTKQYVSDSTGKLTMDMVFDSTDSGEDIRLKTTKIAKFMEPAGSGDEKAPPIVNFEWGLYKFTGMLESYKEMLDYFSSDGVPLRSAINITMASQDKVFEGGSNATKAATGGSAGLPNSSVPAAGSNGKGATDLATKAGNPAAAKAIASANGLDSMRFPGSAAIELDASVSLQGPAGFASAGLGFGVDGDIGISAGGAAFSGLQSAANSATTSLKLDGFLQADASAGLGIDAGSVALGGGASLQGGASLKADVGAAGAFKGRIEFDGGQ